MPFLYVLAFVFGLLFVIYGGDIFIDSSIALAKKSKIPTIIIGATIVSIATTMPELIVSLISAAQGAYGLSVGNAVGSVICNTALIGGLSMTILPTIIKEKTPSLKYFILIFASVLLLLCGFDESGNYTIAWYESLVLLILFVLFMVFNIVDAYKQRKKKKAEESIDITIVDNLSVTENKEEKQPGFFKIIILFIVGAAMIALGSYALVQSSVYFANLIGINDSVIGLTILAVGTSLPELITTITAVKKKNSALGYGNIVGANIINLSLLIGSAGLVSGNGGLPINFYTLWVSIPVMIASSIIFTLPLIFKNKSSRWQGITLLSIYLLYFVFLIVMTCFGFVV